MCILFKGNVGKEEKKEEESGEDKGENEGDEDQAGRDKVMNVLFKYAKKFMEKKD